MNKNLDNEAKYVDCMKKHEEKSKRALQRLGIMICKLDYGIMYWK